MGASKNALLGLMVAMAALAAPAGAVASEALAPTGSLMYSWHGDPARGCAQFGVCGVQGTLIVTPSDEVDYVALGRGAGGLSLNTAPGTVRVLRTDPGSTGTCVQSQPEDQNSLAVRFGAGSSLSAVLNGSQSSGSCAGPLGSDLSRLSLDGTWTRGKHPNFDLRGTVSFTAGPYSGDLTSTLTLAYSPWLAAGSSSASFGGGSGPGVPTGKPQLTEQASLEYAIAPLPSVISVAFHGATAPGCVVLDSCGTSGTISLSLTGAVKVVAVASRPVKKRFGRKRILADLRAGKLGYLSFLGPNQGMSLTETITRAGGSTCTESMPASSGAAASLSAGILVSFLPPLPLSPVPFALSAVAGPSSTGGGSGSFDPVRTHCQGPASSDLFGQTGTLAGGSLTYGQLLSPRSTLTLNAAGSFNGFGYQGATTGAVKFQLTLLKVKAATVMESSG